MIQFKRKINLKGIVFATTIDDEMRRHFNVSPELNKEGKQIRPKEWYLDWYNNVNIELQSGSTLENIISKTGHKHVRDERPDELDVLFWLNENFIPEYIVQK